MTKTQQRVLQAIAEATYNLSNRNSESIARRVNYKGHKASEVIRPLREAGLVEGDYINHRDWTEYSLTPAGWAAIGRTPPIWEER